MKPQKVSWLTLVVNAENQGIALVGEKNFDRVVGVTSIGEHLELGEPGFFEKFEFCGCFGQRHVCVTFFYQKLLQHLVRKPQTRTRESRSVFPAVGGAAEIVTASLGELLAHRHMRLGRRSVLSGRSGAFNFPFFHETKFVVLEQSGSKFGRK